MSAVRGNANQSLYLARILLDAWRAALEGEETGEAVLAEAFLPGVREHLIHAYGWFLLETAGFEDWQGPPPRAVAALPPIPQGKAVAGELREFEILEREGWLGELLAETEVARKARSSRGNLAVAAPAIPGAADARQWLQRLNEAMDRMRDSFDEY